MDTTEQARLQRALKDFDDQAVQAVVDEPVPLSVATILKQSITSDWNNRPERGAALIDATAKSLPDEARRSVMRMLASESYHSLIEQSLDRDWCPELDEDLASVLLDSDEEPYQTLTKYVREQGPAHVLLKSDVLRPQYEPHKGLVELYRTLFEQLPLDTVAPRVADSRNERALKALLGVHDSDEVQEYFTHHTFPSSSHKAANKRAFYERMLRAFDWTDDQLENLLDQAAKNKDKKLLRALRSTQGYKPFDTERLTEMLGDEFTGSINRREFQRALIALGGDIPEGFMGEAFDEIIDKSDTQALQGWLRSLDYDVLVEEQKNDLMEAAARDARLAQVLVDEGVEPSEEQIGEVVRSFHQQVQSGPERALSDPAVFYVLPAFRNASATDMAEYLLDRREINHPEFLDATTALLQAGADLSREQTNLVFEESVEFEKFDTLQALVQTGHRPDGDVFQEVLERRNEHADRLHELMPRRARQARQAHLKTVDE